MSAHASEKRQQVLTFVHMHAAHTRARERVYTCALTATTTTTIADHTWWHATPSILFLCSPDCFFSVFSVRDHQAKVRNQQLHARRLNENAVKTPKSATREDIRMKLARQNAKVARREAH